MSLYLMAKAGKRHAVFLLIALGLAFLLRNLGVVWMRWLGFGLLWPIVPILIGLAFLWRWLKRR